MASKAGQRLTPEEVQEFAAYHNNQITPPAKFDGLVIENTAASGPVYRWETEEEARAGKAAADAASRVAADEAAMTERVRAEAARRGVELPPVPAAPNAPAA